MEIENVLKYALSTCPETRNDALVYIQKACKSLEIRDLDFDCEFYNNVLEIIASTLEDNITENLQISFLLLETVLNVTEFDKEIAAFPFRKRADVVNAICRRFLTGDGSNIIMQQLDHTSIIYLLYKNFPALRSHIRSNVGSFLKRFMVVSTLNNSSSSSHNNSRGGIRLEIVSATSVDCLNPILRLVSTIIQGFSTPLSEANLALVYEILFPLHTLKTMLDMSTPSISIYIGSLVKCIKEIIQVDMTQFPTILQHIINIWPRGRDSNSSIELLYLNEIDNLMELYYSLASSSSSSSSSSSFIISEKNHSIFLKFYRILALCIQGLNSRVAERALLFWTKKYFMKLIHSSTSPCSSTSGSNIDVNSNESEIWRILIRSLLRNYSLHWSSTVNRMTCAALMDFQSKNIILFYKVIQEINNFDEKLNLSNGIDTSIDTESKSNLNHKSKIESFLNELDPSQKISSSNSNSDHDISVDGKVTSSTSGNNLIQKARDNHSVTNVPEQVNGLHFHSFVFGMKDIGTGSFATVRYAKRIVKDSSASTWVEYAVKEINTKLISEQHYEDNLKREVTIMNQLSHPNIIRLIATFNRKDTFSLVLEYCKLGDLHTSISKLGCYDALTTAFVMGEVVFALDCIHRKKIIFNDLKPENILIHASRHVKLGDFGSACYMSEVNSHDRIEGTLAYLAPEVIQSKKTSFASDLWSLGCCIFYCLAGRLPIWDASETKLLKRIVQFDIEKNNKDVSPSSSFYPDGFPNDAIDLLKILWNVDPEKRLYGIDYSTKGVLGVLDHPFFAKRLDFKTPLHTQPPPNYKIGSVAPPTDSRWSRRSFSMMVAPMPGNFFEQTDMNNSSRMKPIEETSIECNSSWQFNTTRGRKSKTNSIVISNNKFNLEGKFLEKISESDEEDDIEATASLMSASECKPTASKPPLSITSTNRYTSRSNTSSSDGGRNYSAIRPPVYHSNRLQLNKKHRNKQIDPKTAMFLTGVMPKMLPASRMSNRSISSTSNKRNIKLLQVVDESVPDNSEKHKG